MHLIVPFAAPGSEAGRGALKELSWPALARRLSTCTIEAPEAGAEDSLSSPAERALATALAWDVADGLVPLARVLASADAKADPGLAVDPEAPGLALATPSHWHLGTEQVSLTDPAQLALDEPASRALHALVAPLFESEGFALHHGAPLRWYLQHPALATLPMASLERVVGRNVDRWLVDVRANPAARTLRRVQNEVQMLLHEHPLNGERERRGLLPVNSLWFSGSGPALPLPQPGAMPRFDERLRGPALAEDWRAWQATWALLDAELAAQPWTRLTLCGERASRSFCGEMAPGRLRRWLGALRPVQLRPLLEAL